MRFPFSKRDLSGFKRVPQYLFSKIAPSINEKPGVIYIGEEDEWVVKWIGEFLRKKAISSGLAYAVDRTPLFHTNKVLHFGSVYNFSSRPKWMIDRNCRVVTTMYHGTKGFDAALDQAVDNVIRCSNQMHRIVVANNIMFDRLVSWGIPKEKLALIPIGFDASRFDLATEEERTNWRAELGIPKDAKCVGSFQKDGVGWGEGIEPKLVKGPDIFCDTVIDLAKRWKIHVLLTGPSRGYVKRRLDEADVPYTHHYLKDSSELKKYYSCLDLYIISSREEGGPIAIMESLACGIPLVSSRVGMAQDVIIDGLNGWLVKVGDVQELIAASEKILKNDSFREKIRSVGPKSVAKLDWDCIAVDYVDLYRQLQ